MCVRVCVCVYLQCTIRVGEDFRKRQIRVPKVIRWFTNIGRIEVGGPVCTAVGSVRYPTVPAYCVLRRGVGVQPTPELYQLLPIYIMEGYMEEVGVYDHKPAPMEHI